MADNGPTYVLMPGDWNAVDLIVQKTKSDGRIQLVTVGHSMMPTLLPGDRLDIVKLSKDIRPGWIVVFPWMGQVLTHRVIRVQRDNFWTRGDACMDEEGPIRSSEALGRMVGLWRDGVWYRRDRLHHTWSGLAYNRTMGVARRFSMRFPGLRRAVEMHIVGGWAGRRLFGWMGGVIFGDITVEEQQERDSLVASLVSEVRQPNQRHVVGAESLVDKDSVRLYSARGTRGTRLGEVVLRSLNTTTTLVSSLNVRPGVRGMGIGRRLLAAVEEAAKREGVSCLVALVAQENVRSQGLFLSLGYQLAESQLLDLSLGDCADSLVMTKNLVDS